MVSVQRFQSLEKMIVFILLTVVVHSRSVVATSMPTALSRGLSRSTATTAVNTLLSLRGGAAVGADELEMAVGAFDWCANLGAPAALVGGAVLATLAETREDLAPKRNESRSRRLTKQATRFLLLSAFGLEIISIFATTVTGTMLLAQGDRPTGTLAGRVYNSPMGFLHHNHEFEYLTARISFLQGLFHWLIATALELAIPKQGEGESAKRMNVFISSSLFTIMFLMLSFYNAHMSFYDNYAHMLWVYVKVVWKRFVWRWPMRPMALMYIPSIAYTLRAGYRAVTAPPQMDKVGEKET